MRTRIITIITLLLSTPMVIAQKSMDEIDRESFAAKLSPMEVKGIQMTETGNIPLVRDTPANIFLDGTWQLAEGGTEKERLHTIWTDQIPAHVPGSIHTALVENGIIPDPYIGQNDSIAEKQSYKTWWMKREFELDSPSSHCILSFGGIANKCTIWLKGKLLGTHEGMFGGPDFSIGNYLKNKNTLIVKLEAIPQMFLGNWPPNANESWKYTVVFNCVYGWHYAQIPSLGIWRSVQLKEQAAVEIESPFIATRSLDGQMRLTLDLHKKSSPLKGVLYAEVSPKNFKGITQYYRFDINSQKKQETLSLDFQIKDPHLWWPNDRGEQSLYDLNLFFVPQKGKTAHIKTSFGIRTIEMRPLIDGAKEDYYNWTFVINGKPMFIKGTGWCTMDALMDFSRNKYEHLLQIAQRQHIQMLRAWGGGMPETDDFYELCDKYGILVMQEWPTAWNSHNTQPYTILQETVERNTKRLRNHPSLIMWGAGNESDKPFGPAIDMMGRLSIELDGTRPFHRGEAWGGSLHNYNCWWDDAHLNHNLNMTAPFWGEFGIASLPHIETVRRYLDEEKEVWPPQRSGNFTHHTPIFGTMREIEKLTQYSGYFMPKDSLASFILGSQLAQVVGVRHTLERARTLWPHTTGALYYKMNDNYPGVSWSCVDYYGIIKPVHYFVQKSFAPLAAVMLFDRSNLASQEVSLPAYLLDDCQTLEKEPYQVKVSIYNALLDTVATHTFNGIGDDNVVKKLGEINLNREQTKSTMLFFVLDIIKDNKNIYRNYYFTNYEVRPGSIVSMPQTEIKMERTGNMVTLTNTGKHPAIGVHVEVPEKMDQLIVSENYIWLNPQESKILKINLESPVIVKGWNLQSPY